MRALAYPVKFLALFAMTAVIGYASSSSQSPPLDQTGESQPWEGDPGRITVIDFAASWCFPCVKSLPRLDTFAAEHPNVTVIVVSVDKKVQGRDDLVQQLDLKLPVLWDGDYAIAEHYQPEGMPTTIVLDESGKQIYRHTGFSEEQWAELVRLVAAEDGD